MGETRSTNAEIGADERQRPEFRGCMFCYSAEWALYAGRKTYETLRQ